MEVEGVPAAQSVQLVGGGILNIGAEKLTSLIPCQRVEIEPEKPRGVRRRMEHDVEPRRQLRRAEGHDHEHAPPRRTTHQKRGEVSRGRVGPVQVVEGEHNRAALTQDLEKNPNRSMSAGALGRRGHRRASGQSTESGKHQPQFVELEVPTLELAVIHRPQVVVQGVNEHPERLVLFELCRPPAEHEMVEALGHRANLADESGLADALFPSDLHDTLTLGVETGDGPA